MTSLTDKELRTLALGGTRALTRILAAELLELRKVYRAAMGLMSTGGEQDPARWQRLAKALKLDKPRGNRAKGVR